MAGGTFRTPPSACNGTADNSYRTDADSEGHIAEGHTAAYELKQRLTEYLELDRESPQDDFAKRYGGLTKKEFIHLAESRFKK